MTGINLAMLPVRHLLAFVVLSLELCIVLLSAMFPDSLCFSERKAPTYAHPDRRWDDWGG